MMVKRLLFIALLLLICNGCVPDSRELDQRSMILGMAIDKGEEKNYAVTIQLPILTEGLGQGEEMAVGRQFESFHEEADTIWDAIVQIESLTPTVLFFGHLKAVAISEAIAREDLEKVINFLDRETTVANQVYLLVVEDELATDFIKRESPLVQLPALYLSRFFDADQKMARAQGVKLFEFLRDSNMISGASSLPIARPKGDQMEIEGMAVFEDYKMVGKLLKREVGIGELLHDNDISSMNYTTVLDHNGVKITVSLTRMNLIANIDYKKSKPVKFLIDVKGDAEVIDVATVKEFTDLEFITKLERKMEKEVKGEIERTIAKMQEINVEPWLLGHRVWATAPSYFETLNWKETGWRNAQFEIDVSFNISNTGQRGKYDKQKIGR
ncbi:Ger(x)C family spore germination protein [Alkalihalobacterium elongatum]|uniref:Ger(x)C family spore germination protein n=1 Tax=Alkalihalobacterium elongatum TaxID=2675466 RepID=UPI001C1F2EAC|nr:Ger(x)C family spore germination protein [Alkalihalobacterium elongatum]